MKGVPWVLAEVSFDLKSFKVHHRNKTQERVWGVRREDDFCLKQVRNKEEVRRNYTLTQGPGKQKRCAIPIG